MQQASLDIPADVTATLVDPRAYAGARIHDAYRWLRANNPLGIARPEGYDPFWVASKFDDIQHVARQHDVFLSGQAGSGMQTTAAPVTPGSPGAQLSAPRVSSM